MVLVFMVVGMMFMSVLVQYVGAEPLKRSSFFQLVVTTNLGMAPKTRVRLTNVAQHIVDPCHV
jgi:hypothetical protein